MSTPFFVLHKASSSKKDRKSSGQGKVRKKTNLSPSSPKNRDKLDAESSGEFNVNRYEELRVEAFEFVWSKIESTIKDVLRGINSKIFNELHRWVRESFNAIRSYGEPSFLEATRSFPLVTNATPRKLFTGFVITKNMEFVDDILTFEKLGQLLQSHGCCVANLSSLDFSVKNGIGGCIKSLLRQFLMANVDAADISILASWYRELGNSGTPLVVVINDLEQCSVSVLSDFILMLSEWIVKVPIILIMGVATTIDSPENILQPNALQLLSPCKFELGSPAEKMDAVVEAVLVKLCTRFTVGHKVALFLRNHFLNQDGTLTSFIRALKIACILHFSLEPLSLILGRLLVEDHKDGIDDVLPDVMFKYVADLPPNMRNQMADQNGKNLAHGLLELLKLQKFWSTVVLCLYEAGKYSKVQLLDLFCDMLDPDLYTSDNHVGIEKYVGLSSSDDLCREYSILRKGGSVCQIVSILRDLPTTMLSRLIKSWAKITADVSEIHDKVKVLQSFLRSEDGKSSKRTSKGISKICSSTSPIKVDEDSRVLNSEAIAFIGFLVGNYMRPIECIPFHEIVCFKNVAKLRLALLGDPRRRVQVDLVEFHKNLRCSCCSRSGNALIPSMHDSAIMYSLAQEHGDLINLHDWYQSFKTVALPHRSKRKKKSNSPLPKKGKDTNDLGEKSEATIQARFCRAVTELQITGLLRMPSKRRPDCVQRVAFGL
ncbi:origin of replication complex subunit 3 [Quillaja saponaria]|uniref:Origin of replication complex subunit 3 n=1 Tax=Quillaja saponaria TaxID=32244 RepID=A0AAD7PRD6_QUISA|nr:origin of replication complex subunit 3 [Quillaja saponaria]